MRRLTFAVEVSVLLYIAAAIVGLILLYRSHALEAHGPALNMLSVIGVIAMPAVAALFFIASCVVLPGLVAPMKLQLPLNLTLPAVFCAFQYMVVNLFVLSDSQVVVLPPPIRSSAAWKDPSAMAMALLLQIAAMSLAVWIARRKDGVESGGQAQ